MNAIVLGVGALGPHFVRYVPRRSEKCGALAGRENAGLWYELEWA